MKSCQSLIVIALFGLLASVPLSAQQSRSAFDVPQVVLGPYDEQFDRILDFDGDGDFDAIGMRAFPATNQTFLALYTNDGTGVFSRVWQTTITQTPASLSNPVAVGDLDNDGDDDFAIGIGTFVHAFRSNGDAPPTPLAPVSMPPGSPLIDLEMADCNGDGRSDFVALSSTRLVVFESLLKWPDPAPAVLVLSGITPIEIVTAQLTGQGPIDIAMATTGPSSVRFYSMDTGTPTLVYSASTAVGAQIMLAAGDLDGDSDDDVVAFAAALGVGTYQVWRQALPGQFVLEPALVGGPATDLADVDGDGDLDGVCCGGGGGGPYPPANNTISTFEIAINDGTGRFAPSFQLEGLGATHIAGARDLDGDGDADLIAGRVVHFAQGPLSRAPAPNSGGMYPAAERQHCFDVDGDGDPDLVKGSHRRLTNRGDGAMSTDSSPVLGLPGYVNFDSRAGDWDGDGDVDLIVDWSLLAGVPLHQLLVNTGGGTFLWGPAATATSMQTEAALYRSLAVDLDNDGDLDLLSTNDFRFGVSGGSSGEVWWNNGAGFFTPGFLLPATVKEVADFNGDGLPDLLVATSVLGWMRNLGLGSFAPPVWLGGVSAVDNNHDQLAVADLDGDGDLDIAAISNGATLVVLANNGSAVFTALAGLVPSPAVSSGNSGRYSVHALHVDGDGRLDLVVGPGLQVPNAVAVYRSTGVGLPYSAPVTQILSPRIFADADGDGDVDVVTSSYTFKNLRYAMPASGRREQRGVGTAGTAGLVPILGAKGPFRGGEIVTCLARGAVGGAAGLFTFGVAETSLANYPVAGVTTYVDPFAQMTLLPFVADGPVGQVGAGSFSWSIPIPPSLFGFDFYHQAFFVDAGAPGLWSSTGLLHLRYGS